VANLASALEIGRSALRAQQIGLNVTGNNIANVNTPGYSRKTPNLTTGLTVDGLGTGVKVASLTRVRDRFLDGQVRFENSAVGKLEAMERAMRTVEAIFTEMAGGGATEPGSVFNQASGSALSGAFSRFFNSFQDLANNPEGQAGRAAVRQEAIFMTDQFNRMHNQLSNLKADVETEFRTTVDEANRLTNQIANLNVKIISLKKSPTDTVGDLEDERDNLVEQLSKLVVVNAREELDGTMTVFVALGEGTLLVQNGIASELGTRSVVRNNAAVSDLVLAGDGRRIDPGAGTLGGLEEARDVKIADYQESLDTLAATIVEQVNAIHAGGFGLDGSSGNAFFETTQTTARLIQVSDTVLNDLDKIAASGSATGPGDGSNALALSDIRLEKVFGGGTQTVEEFYSGLVGRVGAEARRVFTDAEGQRLVSEQLTNRRQNVRGVSINEEATSLILFQRAYQAAARIITIVDEMMESALNM
jgi:flagellar hook-associated protein 1 FlgK